MRVRLKQSIASSGVHADEDHIAGLDGRCRIDREGESPIPDHLAKDRIESGLEDWEFPLLECADLRPITVGANQIVPDAGETSPCYQSDVP
jgi:hypothetical protein